MRNAVGNDGQQLRGGAHQEIVLGDRNRQPVGVDLLEGVGPDHRLRHLPGDGDQRDRVELGVGDRRQEIGRARTGGAEAHGRAPGRAGDPLGDEPRALLVTGEDVTDRAGAERIIEGQARPSGDAGNDADPLAFEKPHREGGTGGLHGSSPFVDAPCDADCGGAQKHETPTDSRRQGFRLGARLAPATARS